MLYSFNNYRKSDRFLFSIGLSCIVKIKDKLKTNQKKRKNKNKTYRSLEIGPGLNALPGFETMNIIDGKQVDYIGDIAKKLPFKDYSFDLIYASHVLEHVPWYQVQDSINELYRVLKKGGILEIWVPDGLKIAQAFVDFEVSGIDSTGLDGWYRFNEEKDPCKWANGRIFTYGDGYGTLNHPNWHRAIFSPRYLQKLFTTAGFVDIVFMDTSEVRGVNHGWINLGIKGTKK